MGTIDKINMHYNKSRNNKTNNNNLAQRFLLKYGTKIITKEFISSKTTIFYAVTFTQIQITPSSENSSQQLNLNNDNNDKNSDDSKNDNSNNDNKSNHNNNNDDKNNNKNGDN